MPVEAIVAISDTHLGAFNSTCSFFVDPEDELLARVFGSRPPNYDLVHGRAAWSVCAALGNSMGGELAALCGPSEVDSKTLVLHGDIVDLSLAPMALCMLNARCFFHWAQDVAGFDHIVYVPGNHDHHLWRMVLEGDALVDAVANGNSVYPRTATGSRAASAIAGLLGIRKPFSVSYPHYVHPVPHKEQEWSIVFHHGHFLEQWWTLVSTLLETHGGKPPSLEQIEALNEPLTELLWFSIGDAGRLSEVASRLYTSVAEPSRMRREIRGIVEVALNQMERHWGIALPRWLPKWMLRQALSRLLVGLSTPKKRPERVEWNAAPLRNVELKGKLLAAAVDYRSRYAALARSCFVLGHTHTTQATEDDFEIDLDAQGLVDAGLEKRILNTGGWVIEPDQRREPNASYFLAAGGKMKLLPFEIPKVAVQAAESQLRA